jgi:hypothetical protein
MVKDKEKLERVLGYLKGMLHACVEGEITAYVDAADALHQGL